MKRYVNRGVQLHIYIKFDIYISHIWSMGMASSGCPSPTAQRPQSPASPGNKDLKYGKMTLTPLLIVIKPHNNQIT